MNQTPSSKKISHIERLSRQGIYLLAVMFLISLLIHLGSFQRLGDYRPKKGDDRFKRTSRVTLKFKELPKNQPAPPVAVKPEVEADRSLPILETPLVETEKPKVASRLGQQDHVAPKETKVKPDLDAKGKDAGVKGVAQDSNAVDPRTQSKATKDQSTRQTTNLQQARNETPSEASDLSKPESDVDGKGRKATSRKEDSSTKLSIGNMKFEYKPASAPRNSYEKMLAFSSPSLSGQVNAGYQDYIEDDIDIADAVDINTQEYRFVGYASAIRKALELVWNYPMEAARRGLQGYVDVVFGINELGETSRIRVVRSSGYPILDDAIVDALRLASPFAPPPEGFIERDKKLKLIKGRFHYALSH